MGLQEIDDHEINDMNQTKRSKKTSSRRPVKIDTPKDENYTAISN